MARYLSAEWIAEMDAAARADRSLSEATAGIELVVQQEVLDGPDGPTSWHLDIDDGSARVLPGRAARADIVFSQDRETAMSVSRGEMSAQTAFMVGRLRVGGDIRVLMAHLDALAAVEDVFAPVRASTEY